MKRQTSCRKVTNRVTGFIQKREQEVKEIKQIAAVTCGNRISIFNAMTPKNYAWINQNVDIAMKASGIPGDIFTKLWVLQYYKFSLDVYLFRHLLLPALTEQLIRNKDTDFFHCVGIVGACLWDIKRKGYITDKEIKATAAKLYKSAMLDSVIN